MVAGLMAHDQFWSSYLQHFQSILAATIVTQQTESSLDASNGVARLANLAAETCGRGNKLMFVGNGGSAAIASHMAIDYTKAGGLRALCFSDGAALTCLANDLGYENAFAMSIAAHGAAGDLVIAISSSGRSPNILRAARAARARECALVTMSGFDPDNPLRALGDLNFYLPSSQYAFVEIGHLTLCHAALDLHVASKSAVTVRV